MTVVAEEHATIKPLDRYVVVKRTGAKLEILCETANFNSAASYHLQHAQPGNGIYLLKNVAYAFTAKEIGR